MSEETQEPVTIEIGEEPESPAEELAPLPDDATYDIVSNRPMTINGHSIEPGVVGEMTLKNGMSPNFAVQMIGRGFKAVPKE